MGYIVNIQRVGDNILVNIGVGLQMKGTRDLDCCRAARGMRLKQMIQIPKCNWNL